MESNFDFDIAALALSGVIMLIHMQRKRAGMLYNKVFSVIVVLSVIGSYSSILSLVSLKYIDIFGVSFRVVTHYIQGCCLHMIAVLFAIYTVTLVTNSFIYLGLGRKLLIIIPAIVDFALIFINIWTKSFFYYAENGSYYRGRWYYILYITLIYFLVYGFSYCLYHKRYTNDKMLKAISFCLMVTLVLSTIQVHKSILNMAHFSVSICLLIVMMMVEKPEAYINSITGAINKEYFDKLLSMNVRNGHDSVVIVIHLLDINMLSSAYGNEAMYEILSTVRKYIEDESEAPVFYLENGDYAIVFQNRKGLHNTYDIMARIDERFNKAWPILMTHYQLDCVIMSVSIPGDTNNVDGFYGYVSLLDKEVGGESRMIKASALGELGRRKAEVKAAIRNAIKNESFELYYQPIYSVSERRIVAAEALVRLNDAKLGYVAPVEFIEIAEKSGLIIPLGEEIFKMAFSFIASDEFESLGLNYIEINLSQVQCLQENLYMRIIDLANEYGANLNRINLEITETATVNSRDKLIKNMSKLYEAGIRFSMDDFGTGYSNITSLIHLPFDIVKFDKSMLGAEDNNKKAMIIYDSATVMVKKMNMRIVSEGIETEEQMRMVRSKGIDYVQGFYFSKPVSERKFVAYVKEFKDQEIA